ncbi:hypothetical protein BY458DRAFT_482331 [Sporodiniella umbellata]|nr:hypothetical protein BY458DRAFT_482331 [Sporodiniella umbellata]
MWYLTRWTVLLLSLGLLKTVFASTIYCIDHLTYTPSTCPTFVPNVRSSAARLFKNSSHTDNSCQLTFDLNCLGSPSQCEGVKATFQKATDIIASAFEFTSPLIVNATFGPTCAENCEHVDWVEYIGQAYPSISYLMVDSTDNVTRMYPQALLKQSTQLTVRPRWKYYDIQAQFNSKVNWYFYNDPSPISTNQTDFLTNVLHELIHGLGFLTSWSDSLFGELRPLLDNLNRFATPRPLAEMADGALMSRYNTTLPFWGFAEFPFDKLIAMNISVHGFRSFSEITQQLNSFYNSHAQFLTVLDFANAWYASDQYRLAIDIYQKTVAQRDTAIMIHGQPTLLLETGLNPFSDGSSLCHVDLATNLYSNESLMVYLANPGITHLNPLGPKLLQTMAALGYRIRHTDPTPLPDLVYWSPRPEQPPTTLIHGPAHRPFLQSNLAFTVSPVFCLSRLVTFHLIYWLVSSLIYLLQNKLESYSF